MKKAYTFILNPPPDFKNQEGVSSGQVTPMADKPRQEIIITDLQEEYG